MGTGENNSQRSVGYGDGVYKSEDGGKSWKNVGLKASEHIGKILVHPKDSNVVYVAAQGPLWAPGGDRGLYKTTDGGKTWTAVLTIDENTGVTDVVMDPRDPDTLVAAAYQRRRHVFTLIDGGPGSGLHKTTDGGQTWKKITSGLPKEDMGRIGLALAPTEPDTVYALVETAAASKAGGTFRSTNRGETWEKRGDYNPGGPMYYQEIFVDPKDAERALLDGHVPEGVGRRRQDLDATSASATSTWTTTRCGSTPTTPTTTWSGATAASTRASTGARRGSSSRTCPSPSSTGWTWTTPRPSTTSTAAPRTTTPSAAPPAP